MTSSDCLSSNNHHSRLSSISRLNLSVPAPNNTNTDSKNPSSCTTTPTSVSPNTFYTPTSSTQPRFPQPNMFAFPRQPPPQAPILTRRNIHFKPPEQDVLDKNFFRTFNMEQKEETLLNKHLDKVNPIGTASTSRIHIEGPNLIDMGIDPPSTELLSSGNVFELFDPLKQSNRPHSWPTKLNEAGINTPTTTTPPFVTPTGEPSPVSEKKPSISSLSYPYPVKLRLKLTTFPEIKSFSHLAQQIRNENQIKQTTTDEIFYCTRVQRLTPQHIEQKQLPVTLHIFVDGAKEPIRLTNISLQSTVAHILYQLLELTPFDYDKSILKLRSREEYLRNEDVLCDIEYVYNCINSLKQLQFVLVQKPTYALQQNQQQINNISFEQFCLDQQGKTFNTLTSSLDIPNGSATVKKSRSPHRLSHVHRTKSLNVNKQATYSHQAHIAHSSNAPFLASDPRWLVEFRKDINLILSQIEQRFNRLVISHQPQLSISEQIKTINELLGFIKNIQVTCSYIQSSLIVEKERELKIYADQLIKKSQFERDQQQSPQIQQSLTRLLYDLLVTLVNYIRTYCHAYLIPYEVEIYNDENSITDLELLKYPPTTKDLVPRPITESSELFSVYIDSIFSLRFESNIKSIRIVTRLCYGNETKARKMTESMSFIRHHYHSENVALKPQVRFNQWILFDDARLCELQREALLLFEIYATFNDEIDSSSSPALSHEVFDGIPMYLIGWCSQALFDSEHCLLTGERYLGIFNAPKTNRTGFYSLRNVFERDCSILCVSFLDQSFIWPDIQARNDIHGGNFTEISRDKQENLCRLLKRPTLLLVDHSAMAGNDNRKQQFSLNMTDEEREFSEDECHFLWSHRHFIVHKSYALPKLLKSRSVWDYPSLIDIYALLNEVTRDRTIDEIEAFELLLPAFPDMHIRSFAYQSLITHLTTHDLLIYLPQLLQIIKYDYSHSSILIEYLLKQSLIDHRLAHKLYWHLRQLLITEHLHYIRYYYLFLSLLYVLEENFRVELQNEYDLCLNLKSIGLKLKTNKSNSKGNLLFEQLKEMNNEFFQSGKLTCRLPCQFNFMTNSLDVNSCSFYNSLTVPIKLVFNPIDSSCEKYYSIYKIGDDLRQDQIVLQLFSCMDKIWQANDLDYRLSLFNVVQTQERCGFIEMITESETLREIESRSGTIKGSFGESALYDWLRLHNTTEREFSIAIENLTYSCAAYCVATYILGIGDRHNDNIMVKQSGHLFHIDFGKYLGDTQKFGWFNRDRAPFVFTKQMLYAMSDGGTSNDALHRFVDLCCNAFCTIRQNSSLLLLLLSHLCSSNVSNLNYDAVRFVYDRLSPSTNYADSITNFTGLIVDSLNSTWTTLNFLIHTFAQTSSLTGSSNTMPIGTTLSFIPKTYTIATDGKIKAAQIVSYEKRTHPTKHYIFKLKVEREILHDSTMIQSQTNKPSRVTYHYRTYNEFYEFYERLNKQFPLINLELKFSRQTEDKIVAQRRVSDMNDFLGNLFRLTSEVVESDLVITFFHMIQQDQQLNDAKEKSTDDFSSRSIYEPPSNNHAKIRLQLKYDSGKLFVMVRYANNLPLINNSDPNPYCKCYLFPDECKSTKRKGRTVMNSRNPIFNDTFTYQMDLSEIQKRLLRVSVWNNVLTAGNQVLGEVDIVLSQVDWSKENARDYPLVSHHH
ncbi:unnamed protein product [Adineta steineri]|uniref:phosphatidylinositol 3-kinase n=1 Tax=Adineta steineri TaxID=433720 RepID=A0A813YTE3_9BILA|nr:unnamed protein product [Adineta steineri]CAF3510692.1 unnamed protein product [Adineta steineri]